MSGDVFEVLNLILQAADLDLCSMLFIKQTSIMFDLRFSFRKAAF